MSMRDDLVAMDNQETKEFIKKIRKLYPGLSLEKLVKLFQGMDSTKKKESTHG